MREISLHLMDIIENSISAGATLIQLNVHEQIKKNVLAIDVIDNGCGMSKELLEVVTDPFVTSRTTRKVGLGISLFKSACERCDGTLTIESELQRGTSLHAFMVYDHIDRAPLGRIQDTLVTLLLSPGVEIVYTHGVDENSFLFDSREIRQIAGDNLSSPEILIWIKDYINENIENIGGGKW